MQDAGALCTQRSCTVYLQTLKLEEKQVTKEISRRTAATSRLTRAAQSFLPDAKQHVQAQIAICSLGEVLESPDVIAVLLERVVDTFDIKETES